jgi:hypothetical protein
MGSIFGRRSQLESLFFETHGLEPGEVVLRKWVASVPLGGRFSKHGGNLVLTNKRILFEPMRLPSWTPLSKYLAPFAEHEGSASLSDMSKVEAVPGTPQGLRLVSASGQSRDFLIFAHRFSTIWSTSNAESRDDALNTINESITAQRVA